MSDEKSCKVEGCDLAYRSRSFCWKHLAEAKARGQELTDGRKRGPLPDVDCRVEGCDALSRYRGKRLCQVHYRRLRDFGSTELPEPPKLREIIASRRTITENGCWEWTGAVSTSGYGRVGAGYVHRLAHDLYIGPIPDGHQIDHLCRNRTCFNPDHLEAVTQEVNLRRQMEFLKRDEVNGRIIGST